MSSIHVPILLEPIATAFVEAFHQLPPNSPPHWMVDCTLGGGGHTAELLRRFSEDPALAHHKFLGIDQDPNAIAAAQKRFQKEISEGRLELLHCRMSESRSRLEQIPVGGILADLGFSSDQMGAADRGLSFHSNGPLDMRLDPTRGLSCLQLLQQISQKELETLLLEYGEERFASRIASGIIAARMQGRMPTTTQELSLLIIRSIPAAARHGRLHAATKSFQALRIAVNEELSELDSLLNDVLPLLNSGGRAAILSFHSLEDRKIKVRFKNATDFEPTTKKPLQASIEEVQQNPRSRSAKLRIADKVG